MFINRQMVAFASHIRRCVSNVNLGLATKVFEEGAF